MCCQKEAIFGNAVLSQDYKNALEGTVQMNSDKLCFHLCAIFVFWNKYGEIMICLNLFIWNKVSRNFCRLLLLYIFNYDCLASIQKL